jgi:hypothetical protein
MAEPTAGCIRCQHPVFDHQRFRARHPNGPHDFREGEICWIDESVTDVMMEVLRKRSISDRPPVSQNSLATNTFFIKRRPCIILQGGPQPLICIMATFEGTDYSKLSEALRIVSLPIWPMSGNLPPDVALSHLHSTPDMESPKADIADGSTDHWRYAIAHPFLSQGRLYRSHKGDALAKRRFPRKEVDKIIEKAESKKLVFMNKCLDDPQYFHTQWQEYRVIICSLHWECRLHKLRHHREFARKNATLTPDKHSRSTMRWYHLA